MKRLTNGKYVHKGYSYMGYEVRNHGYYSPDKANWWEAINVETGCADHHAHTKKDLKKLIDNQSNLTCMVCGKEYKGEEPKMCCSGRDCGCMGLPIDPLVCSNECWDKLPFNTNK